MKRFLPFLLSTVALSIEISLELSPMVVLTDIAPKGPGYFSIVEIEDPYFSTLMDPFLSVDLAFGLLGGRTTVGVSLRTPWIHSVGFTNLPSDPYVNATLVEKAHWEYWDRGIELSIGRKKRRFGPMAYPLSLSNIAPYFDGLDLKSEIFSYHIYALEPFLTESERETQCTKRPVNAVYAYCDELKLYTAHFLNFGFGDFRFSIGESALIWGKIPSFELNPFMIWHFLYKEGHMNSQFVAFGSWDLHNVRFKWEILIDDVAIPPYEPPDVKPTAIAYAFGIDIPRENLEASVEYYHVDDWVYNREVPYPKFSARFLRVTNTRYYEEYPIGFPFGPGCDVVIYRQRLYFEGSTVEVEIGLVRKKDVHLSTDYKSEISGFALLGFSSFELSTHLFAFGFERFGSKFGAFLKKTWKF